jgi:hypothetical protein
MRLADKMLVHQVHPAKIAADITASVTSSTLLWKGRRKAAMAVRIVLPMGASLIVLSVADLDKLARTPQGRYVRKHMPPTAQAVRLAGDAVMGLGARRRSRVLVVAGVAIVVAGWSHALWPRLPGQQ